MNNIMSLVRLMLCLALAIIIIMVLLYFFGFLDKPVCKTEGMMQRPAMAEFLSLPDPISSAYVFPRLKQFPVQGNYAPVGYVYNSPDLKTNPTVASYVFDDTCLRQPIY